jgi:phage protein D
MIVQVRAARPSIMLNGKDYYSSLAPYLLNLTYSDNCDGEKADDLQFQLADRDKRFISDWMPDIGVFLDVSIITERWFSPNSATMSLDCGRFWIDSIDFELPQHTASVKASSLPSNVRIKKANETRGWENSTLQDIAQQIAGENQMQLDWQADVNPKYERIEQNEESALQFLKSRANDAKLSIKVHRNTLVIFDEETYEAAAPSFTLAYGNVAGGAGMAIYRVESAHFILKLTDTKKKQKVSYSSTSSGDVTTEEALDEEEGQGESEGEMTDYMNQNPGEEGENGGGNGGPELFTTEPLDWQNTAGSENARRKAEAELRNANKHRYTGTIQLSIGNPIIAAGQTFDLRGVGQFDGKWFIESAQHNLGPEYNTELIVRRCLKGY